MSYMQEQGFTVVAEDMDNTEFASVKQRYQVPDELQSCHTAIVDGYVIEGHVPAADVRRLLAERPDVVGLAVPGMPVGSPGMEVPGQPAEPFQVLAFDKSGQTEVFATYNP